MATEGLADPYLSARDPVDEGEPLEPEDTDIR
jgi:hypothetical protein